MQAAEWTYEYSAFGYYKQQKLWDIMGTEKQTSVVIPQDVNLILCGRRFNNLANTTVAHCASWTKYVIAVLCGITEDWGRKGVKLQFCTHLPVCLTQHIPYCTERFLWSALKTDSIGGRLCKNHPLSLCTRNPTEWSYVFFSNLPHFLCSQAAGYVSVCVLHSKLPSHISPPAGGLETRRDTHTSRASTGRHFNNKLLRRQYTEVWV